MHKTTAFVFKSYSLLKRLFVLIAAHEHNAELLAGGGDARVPVEHTKSIRTNGVFFRGGAVRLRKLRCEPATWRAPVR